jgi:type VI secretion system secreted protein Hcp
MTKFILPMISLFLISASLTTVSSAQQMRSIAQARRIQPQPTLSQRTIPFGYVKIEGIEGDSTDSAHKKWIEISSLSFSVTQPMSRAGGRTGGRADFSNIVLTKSVDIATPDLFIHAANGKHIPKLELEFQSKGREYSLELKDAVITGVNTTSGNNKTWLSEEISVSYGQITITYKSNAGAPVIDRAWDIERNRQR